MALGTVPGMQVGSQCLLTATVFVNAENKQDVLRRVLPEHRLINVYHSLATFVCLAREPTFYLVIFK